LDAIAKALKVTLSVLLASEKRSTDHSAGEHVWESVEASMPDSLREFIRRREKQEKIPADIKRALTGIRFRGNRPERPEDWELIYLAIKRGVERG
jgi:hypothetical protein